MAGHSQNFTNEATDNLITVYTVAPGNMWKSLIAVAHFINNKISKYGSSGHSRTRQIWYDVFMKGRGEKYV